MRRTPLSRTVTSRCSSATPSRKVPEPVDGSTWPPRLRRQHPDDPNRDALPSTRLLIRSGGPTAMKLGFLTAPFPQTPLMEVRDWAAGAGFEVLEIACGPAASGPPRRYAGTSHIDVANLTQ